MWWVVFLKNPVYSLKTMDTVSQPEAGRGEKFFKDILLPSGIILLVIVGGIFTGWKVAGSKVLGARSANTNVLTNLKKGVEVGSTDTKTFKDEAEGTLQADGVNGEGAYHLDREGGPTQTAALTSSVIDLSEFVGKKVHIWGQTFASTKAAWLMDVGKIKVVE